MRGKSIDNEYVAAYIQNCVADNKSSPEEICNDVLDKIAAIDKQLIERTKLADVLGFFNYKKPMIKQDVFTAKVSFDDLDMELSGKIVAAVEKNGIISINDLIDKSADDKRMMIYTLKQLVEKKVLFRSNNEVLSPGQNYDAYKYRQE